MRTTRLMTLLVISTMGGFSLGGCSVDTNTGRVLSCPSLVEYSPEEQKQAAREIRQNPNGQTAKMITDYGKLRHRWTPELDKQLLKHLARGLSHADVAKLLGVSRNTVCGRVYRLKKKGQI